MNKKKVFGLSVLLLFSVIFFSCNSDKKELSAIEQQFKSFASELTGEMACFVLTGCSERNEIKTFYYPQSLKNLAARRYIKNGSCFYYFELYNPDKKSVVECSGFYDGLDGNTDWIDELVFKLEEERIADQIQEMDEIDTQKILETDKSEEIEKVLGGNVESVEYLDKDSNLKFMEFDNEILIPRKTEDGYEIIYSVNSMVIRNVYDFRFRLITSENWNMSSTDNPKLLKTQYYVYKDDTQILLGKQIIEEKTETQILYSETGLIFEKYIYDLDDEKKYLTGYAFYKYDDINRIKEECSTSYQYSAGYIKRIEEFQTKQIFTYNEGEDIPADFDYYENNILKMRNKYAVEKGTYTSQIFFTDSFSVKTYYENYLKIRDVYTENGVVVRVKEYEN